MQMALATLRKVMFGFRNRPRGWTSSRGHGEVSIWTIGGLADALSQLITHREIVRYRTEIYGERGNPLLRLESQTTLHYGMHYRRFDFSS